MRCGVPSRLPPATNHQSRPKHRERQCCRCDRGLPALGGISRTIALKVNGATRRLDVDTPATLTTAGLKIGAENRGIIMGIRMALMEHIVYNHRATAGTPASARGVEITVTAVAPAITNAINHATARRIRELPITPDKLL